MHDGILHRYSRNGVSLQIAARVRQVPYIESNRYLRLSGEGVKIVQVKYGLGMFKDLWMAVNQADLVISRVPSFFGILAGLYALIQRKPLLTEVVGNAFWPLWYSGIKGKVLAPFMVVGTRLVVRLSDYSVYITEKYLQELYPGKVMIPGLTNVTIEPEVLNELHLVKKRRINRSRTLPQPVRIGMLAGLDVWYKGHDILLKAVKELQETGNKQKLIVELVGSGEASRLKSLVDSLGLEHVMFKGAMANDEVLRWMGEIDIYVQPSRTEAHGRAVIEAMSAGCMVVATDVGGMRETVHAECRFQMDDVSGLGSILNCLLTDRLLREDIINHSIMTAMQFGSARVEERRRGVMDAFYALNQQR